MNSPKRRNETNSHGQTVGFNTSNWQAPQAIHSARETQGLNGRYCQLVWLEDKHAPLLKDIFAEASDSLWTYLPYGPFKDLSGYEELIDTLNTNWRKTSQAYCIQSADGENTLGFSAYLRMMPETGSIEIGHLCFSPRLQKTPAATEAIFLMLDAVFKLGYRRCEWKCNDLNLPSIKAAKRYGFSYEGTFRQAQIVKKHNRDTAWFSILDHEWPKLKTCFESWLQPSNFDGQGRQIKALSELTKEIEPQK